MRPISKYIGLFIILQVIGIFAAPQGIDQVIQFIIEQWMTWLTIMLILTFGIGWLLPKMFKQLLPFLG